MNSANAVLETIKTRLTGQTMAGANVFHGRTVPYEREEFPAIDIRFGGDKPETMGSGCTRREVKLSLRTITRGDNAEADSLNLMAEAHALLMADATLSGAVDAIQEGDGDADLDEGDGANAIYTKTYTLLYLTKKENL